MEQPFSTSKVTVEYFDPHGVYKLLAPGLVPRLPLHHLHWQSHTGHLRSIDTLHVELVSSGADPSSVSSPLTSPSGQHLSDTLGSRDDGFQTASIGGWAASAEPIDALSSAAPSGGKERRHQIPGLRRTPYLKVLFVRCDDNDSYKSQARPEIRDWIKHNTVSAGSAKKINMAENHDAFEWMIVHVVIPNTVAATQPRSSKTTDGTTEQGAKSSSRWGKSSSTLLEKIVSDFNGSSKNAMPRIAQIRIGINDVPYDVLPRVVPAVPSGYVETEKDAENAWQDLVDKMKDLILSSFDMRVSQYEEDVREKDAQRSLPGWNFCTFFILKEGLARGFESVGLVEDALVGYDELSVGLDTIVREQAVAGSAETHGGALLRYTDDLKRLAQKALSTMTTRDVGSEEDEEPLDLQSANKDHAEPFEEIPISSTKKSYRELILANNVSVFDFRCYIFARQVSLLLRLGNAWSTREDLLAKLQEQQESISVLHGVAPRAPPPKPADEPENLAMLAEICRRALEFIPTVSQVMRRDLISAILEKRKAKPDTAQTDPTLDPVTAEVVDNIVASHAFAVAQQILAQTSTKALPIPTSFLASPDSHELKASIPEPKTMMHPARSSSLHVLPGARPPPSPGIFPGPGRRASGPDADTHSTPFLKAGLEELASRRAELYALSRSILEESGKKRGWTNGWDSVPVVGDPDIEDMEDINLNDGEAQPSATITPASVGHSPAGFDSHLLLTALDNTDDFYRLYETLTDKALRHYTVAGHTHSVQANLVDLSVLKYHLQDFRTAADYFYRTIPFFGESGWSLLELSMLVMYSRCLKKLGLNDEYVRRGVLKLLSKAASAEKERLEHQSSLRVQSKSTKYPDVTTIKGFLHDMLQVSEELPNEVQIPVASFLCDVEVDGPPHYGVKEDSFSLELRLRSLLADDLPLDSAKVRMVSCTGESARTIWLGTKGALNLKPGIGRVQLFSNDVIPDTYKIVQIRFSRKNLCLHYDRDPSQPINKDSTILGRPYITLYQRAGAFDIRLAAAKHTQLDKNNALDLDVSSGWNEIISCEIRIRAATGGLRLITSEAKVVGSQVSVSKPMDGGVLALKSLGAGTSVKISFPFTVEQEVNNISLKVDASYSTEYGTFTLSKSPSVGIGLALGVNVQDVFKHKALFSRFTVSTASTSPLRLFKSELLESDIFGSHFGIPPDSSLFIFPKQPASLLYKITRKPGSKIRSGTQKSMYIKLLYSVLHDEIEFLIEQAILAAIQDSPFLDFSPSVLNHIRRHVRSKLTAHNLERAALLGEISTSFLTEIKWTDELDNLGQADDGEDIVKQVAMFLARWQKRHPKLLIPEPDPVTCEPCSLLIPVDVPSITVVHTADIRFDEPLLSSYGELDRMTTCVNQLIPATLHLKWTRGWDTGSPEAGITQRTTEDLEFSFEVTAPADTWLLGGRRKGHFVIPASDPENESSMSSTPETEAEIPLLLIPLREGWLPYPIVEIREVLPPGEDVVSLGQFELDYRNLGETVRVVADRQRITLSLDASGPGGGPLVLESQGMGLDARVLV